MKYTKNAKPGTYPDASGFEAQQSENGKVNTSKLHLFCTYPTFLHNILLFHNSIC